MNDTASPQVWYETLRDNSHVRDYTAGEWLAQCAEVIAFAQASGPQDAVQALVDWAHHGPELARVDGVAVTEAGGDELPGGFGQRKTV